MGVEVTLMYGDPRRQTPARSPSPVDAGEAEAPHAAGRRAGAIGSALVPLVLAAPVLYFGVVRAVETGRALRQAGWHPGVSLPSTVPFSSGGPLMQSAATAPAAEVPVGEALLMVLFCLGMGCFLLSATLRALRQS